MILTLDERQVRFIDSVRLEKRPDIKSLQLVFISGIFSW